MQQVKKVGELVTIASVNVNVNASALPGVDRNAAESRRANTASPSQQATPENASTAERQQFVLGAGAYRRVLATLESDRSAETGARVQRDGEGSYIGQRAQRAYQDAAADGQREALASLFGVDLFA